MYTQNGYHCDLRNLIWHYLIPGIDKTPRRFDHIDFVKKHEFYGHFSGEHLFKNIAIFESTMKRTSAVLTCILELYIFPWRVQTVDLDCAWRFKIYVSRLAEAWRYRDNPPCEL